MRKKIMTLLLASTVTVALLAGCNEDTEGDTTPTPTVEATAPEGEQTPAPTEAPEGTPTEAPTDTPTETPAVTEGSGETKVTLGQYEGLVIHELDSSVIAEEMYTMMQDYAELTEVDRAAVEGDTVNINFVGKVDGVAFEGGTDDSEEGTDLTLGSGEFIPGFEEGLIGAIAGEVRDLTLTFPADYGMTDLAGQEAVFTVTVNAVMESVVPELTDDFAAENLGFSTVAEYVTALYNVRNEESFRTQVLDMLLASSAVENYPADEIAYEKQSMIDYYVSYAEYIGSYFGMDTETALQSMFGIESLEVLEIYAEEYAYDVVKQRLVFEEISVVENLTLSDEEYQQRALVYAIDYGYEDVASFEADYDKDMIMEAIVMDYVMDYIISLSTIIPAEDDAVIQPAE